MSPRQDIRSVLPRGGRSRREPREEVAASPCKARSAARNERLSAARALYAHKVARWRIAPPLRITCLHSATIPQKSAASALLFSPWDWWIDAETEGGLEMAHRVKSVARRASMTAWFAAVCLLLSPGMVRAQGIGDYFQTHTHGYLDNFTILRNDTFKDDYHVASSRYRLDLQFSGPIGEASRPWGLPFDRFEYFLDIRPEYESAYDVSDRFGSDPGISTSGRGVPPTSTRKALPISSGHSASILTTSRRSTRRAISVLPSPEPLRQVPQPADAKGRVDRPRREHDRPAHRHASRNQLGPLLPDPRGLHRHLLRRPRWKELDAFGQAAVRVGQGRLLPPSGQTSPGPR